MPMNKEELKGCREKKSVAGRFGVCPSHGRDSLFLFFNR